MISSPPVLLSSFVFDTVVTHTEISRQLAWAALVKVPALFTIPPDYCLVN
jgi:hypothetical protein